MRAFSCHCGAELSATDTATLVGPVHGHFAGAHPEYGLTPVSVRNYLEAEDRATGGTERLDVIEPVRVRPVSPDLADEIIDFFDHDLFPDNPAWASCYCMFSFLGGQQNPDWGNQPWREVRQAQRERISTGRTTGVVAYSGDHPAGWCNATARSEFPSHRRSDDDSVCSIVCFAVAPPYRGHGVAALMLEGAVSMARDRGFEVLESYPVRDPAGPQAAYHGTLEMFLRQGFRVTSDDPLTVQLEL